MLMNKILRYSFMALLAMMVGNVMATEITFLPSEFAAATSSNYSLTKDGVTVAVTSSTVTADQFRIFKSQTITISSTAGNITKAVFTCTAEGDAKYGPGCFSEPTTGSYAYEGAVGTWTGEATEFSMTAATNQVRATSIVVTVSGAPSVIVEVPKFSIASGLYLETQSVAMSCEEGAKILYTIPAGQDPVYVDDENVTGEWYDGTPLEITRTTTIKAMAVKDGKTSGIVTAKYTIVNTTGKGTVESPFSVADALQVVAALDKSATTSESYYVKGFVVGTPDIQKKEDGTYYGNANFTIADTKGGADLLTCFRLKGLENENIESDDYVQENDEVLLVGQLQKYVKNDEETPEIKNGHIVSITRPEIVVVPEPVVEGTKIAEMDYTTAAQYPYYRMEPTNPEAGNFDVKDGALVISATAAQANMWEMQPFILDWFNIKAGNNYNIAIYMEATSDVDLWLGFGTWAGSMALYGQKANAARGWNYYTVENATAECATSENNAHILFQCGSFVGTIKIYKVELYEVESTGINNVKANVENAVRYNLAGQKVNNGFKGVVIMNGKKMLQK